MLSVFPSISGCHKISFFSVLSVFLSSFSAGTKNDISLRQFLKYMEDVYFTLLCNALHFFTFPHPTSRPLLSTIEFKWCQFEEFDIGLTTNPLNDLFPYFHYFCLIL